MRFFAAIVLALPAFAAASRHMKLARTDNIGSPTECTTAPIQCCNSYVASNSTEGKNYLKLSGLHNHPNANDGTVGVDCSPLAQIVNLGDTCASKPTCCSTNGGLIAIGCVPIDV